MRLDPAASSSSRRIRGSSRSRSTDRPFSPPTSRAPPEPSRHSPKTSIGTRVLPRARTAGAVSRSAARDDAAVDRRASRGRVVGAAEDRTALSSARAHRHLPAAALDADGCRGSRRRVVLERPPPGRDRCARHFRRGAGAVVSWQRRHAAAQRGGRSRTGRQQRHRQGWTGRADACDGGSRARGWRRDSHRRVASTACLSTTGARSVSCSTTAPNSRRARSSRMPIRAAHSSTWSIPASSTRAS